MPRKRSVYAAASARSGKKTGPRSVRRTAISSAKIRHVDDARGRAPGGSPGTPPRRAGGIPARPPGRRTPAARRPSPGVCDDRDPDDDREREGRGDRDEHRALRLAAPERARRSSSSALGRRGRRHGSKYRARGVAVEPPRQASLQERDALAGAEPLVRDRGEGAVLAQGVDGCADARGERASPSPAPRPTRRRRRRRAARRR